MTKALIGRLLGVSSLSLLLILVIFLWGLRPVTPVSAYSPSSSSQLIPQANYHLWEINEIFSCADGSIQFIELFTTVDGQQVLAGHVLSATNLAATQTNTFTFPTDSGSPTANKYLLIATANFTSLVGSVNPDFIIQNSFLFTDGGSISILPFGDTFTYTSGALPLDGSQSLKQDGTIGLNTPRNFAGNQGSVNCNTVSAQPFIFLPMLFKSPPPVGEHDADLGDLWP